MNGDKMAQKTEGVRLSEDDKAWLNRWVRASGHDRSQPIRAGLRLLRMCVDHLDYGHRVRFIARLSSTEPDIEQQKSEILGTLLARAVIEARVAEEEPFADSPPPPQAGKRKRGPKQS